MNKKRVTCSLSVIYVHSKADRLQILFPYLSQLSCMLKYLHYNRWKHKNNEERQNRKKNSSLKTPDIDIER